MSKLKRFFDFYQELNEIAFTRHWKERSAFKGEQKSEESRIVERDPNHTYGWRIFGLMDENGNLLDSDSLSSKTLSEKEIYSLISIALRDLTRSMRLEKWTPDGEKTFNLLKLGRVFLWDGKQKKYILFSPGKGPVKTGAEYPPGDMILGVCKDFEVGVTFLFTSSKEDLNPDVLERIAKMSNIDRTFFLDYSIQQPYGKNFDLGIDLTSTSFSSAEKNIRSQIKGETVNFSSTDKEIKAKDPFYLSPDFKRIQIAKGVVLTKVSPNGTKMSYEILDNPKNAMDLYSIWQSDKADGTDNLKKTTIIVPAEEVVERVTTYGGSKMIKTGKRKNIELIPGETLMINRIPKGTQIDPSIPYVFKWITSEPSILKKGAAQIALDIL